MFNALKVSAILALAGIASSGVAVADPVCHNPLERVMATLKCTEVEDPVCAAAGYSPDFVKLHNTVDTHSPPLTAIYWAGAYAIADFHLDFDLIQKVNKSKISLRYIETITFITGDVYQQHEAALVTVDSDCRIVLWDQYGDNKEQQDVEDKTKEILKSLFGH